MSVSRPDGPQPRKAIEICSPIALQFLDGEGDVRTPWMVADILDVSVGGLCLLISEESDLTLCRGLPLRLDVSSQPSFGRPQIGGRLCWFVRSGLVVTLGLVFDNPLAALPELGS